MLTSNSILFPFAHSVTKRTWREVWMRWTRHGGIALYAKNKCLSFTNENRTLLSSAKRAYILAVLFDRLLLKEWHTRPFVSHCSCRSFCISRRPQQLHLIWFQVAAANNHSPMWLIEHFWIAKKKKNQPSKYEKRTRAPCSLWPTTEKMPHQLQASQYVVMILSMAAAILNTVIIVLLPVCREIVRD